MTAVVRADALRLPLRDQSVHLIVTSPPYYTLRSYRDGGDHYDGQIGSEPTPQAFLEALWAVTKECWRVLAPSGSMFVNLGDKRSGGGIRNNTGFNERWGNAVGKRAQEKGRPTKISKAAFGRPKSKMLLPHRYAIGCEDGLADPDGIGWIVRQDMVWSKPNGLPESVRDRTRDAHEYWFHLTKQPDYFAAIDEIREPSDPKNIAHAEKYRGRYTLAPSPDRNDHGAGHHPEYNPLGKLPSSVWTIPSEPLVVPDWLGIDHFAAFPSELPRRLILGFTPTGICVACGEGRRPVVLRTERTITGYACACTNLDAPTRPAVVLDPFGGTGTTAMVARALGRTGISVDLSADYNRLATWRIFDSGHAAKARRRTNEEAQMELAV